MIVLLRPEIPGNVGAVMRTCACFGLKLAIVGPLPFVWDEKRVKREVMDYIDLLHYTLYGSWEECRNEMKSARVVTTSADAATSYRNVSLREDDLIVFGSESTGIDAGLISNADLNIKIPMVAGRSLNLSVSVGIIAASVAQARNK